MSELKNLFSWWVPFRNNLEAAVTNVYHEFLSALGETWKQISPEVATLAKQFVPIAADAGAAILASGGSLLAAGEAVGKELVKAGVAAETNIAPGALTLLANEAIQQILVHPSVVNNNVAQGTLANGSPAANHAALVAAAVGAGAGTGGN